MNPLLEQFVIESRDFLESIANGLLTLEREPGNVEAISELFRGVHTLKGNSGLFPEYSAFTHLVHAGEDLLDAVRDGRRSFDAEIADHLLECMDIVSAMLDCIEAGNDLAPTLCDAGKELAVSLRALREGSLGGAAASEPDAVPGDPPPESVAPDDNGAADASAELTAVVDDDAAEGVADDVPAALASGDAGGEPANRLTGGSIQFRYTPEPTCFFKGDDPLFTAINAPGLVSLSVSPLRPWPDSDSFDPYECNLVIEGGCEATREELEQHFRYVPDQVEFNSMAANSGQAMAADAVSEPDPQQVDTLAGRGLSEEEEAAAGRILRCQYEVLARTNPENSEGVWRSVAYVLRGLASAHGIGHEPVDEALEACLKTDSGDPLARVLDRMAAGTRTGDAPAPAPARAHAAPRARLLNDTEAELVDRILASHTRMLDGEPSASVLLAAATALAGMRRYEGRTDDAAAIEALGAAADAAGLRQVMADWHGSSAVPAAKASDAAAPVKPAPAPSTAGAPQVTASRPAAEPAVTPAAAAAAAVQRTVAAAAAATAAARPAANAGAAVAERPTAPAGGGLEAIRSELAEAAIDHGANRVLKVSQEKIDRLMDLIGEMVVAKNALPYLAARAEVSTNPREIAREIKNQYGVINRIAEEMQDAIMQVRMLPVGNIFQRFPRLVRDISRKLGKQVELYMEGEDAEADKNIVESLADPLIHIVRNSLDHGLEPPEERRAAGKPDTGIIRITAFQEADRVIIEISDDGRGIDPARIKAKALERGMIDEARAATLTDHEAVQLVFAAGFSTAEQISDLSGRGVGMDVVRSAIEKAHGSVQLSSELGRGTRIRIALPLSMAVTNVMIIRSAEQMFGVQMDMVVETVRVPAKSIHEIKQQRTTVLRGRIVPLYALNDLLRIPEPPRPNEEGEVAVLVIRLGEQDVGVIVDDFDATLDLILKPLDGVLGELGGYSGTALLGDGSVLMVLNLKELL